MAIYNFIFYCYWFNGVQSSIFKIRIGAIWLLVPFAKKYIEKPDKIGFFLLTEEPLF